MSDKILIIVLTIITLGLIWIKWKKDIKHTKNTIYQVNKIPFDIAKLKKYLGENNIIEVKNTATRIIISFSNIELIKVEEIKKLRGVSGVFLSSKNISLILGEYALAVYNQIIN